MNQRDAERCRRRARTIKALAHPTRLYLVELLARGERCVCDLTDRVGADVSTVSRHLAQLREAGILADDKRGQQVFYRLRTECVLGFLDCVDEVCRTSVRGAAVAPGR